MSIQTMKLLITVIVVFCFTVHIQGGEFTKATLSAAETKCIKESKVNPDTVLRAIKGDFKDDPNLKKYMKCFFETLGVLKGSTIDEAELKAYLGVVYPIQAKGQTADLVKRCATIKHDKPEEYIFAMAKCRYVH